MDNSSVNELFKKLENTDLDALREAAEQEKDKTKRELMFSMYIYTLDKKDAKVLDEMAKTPAKGLTEQEFTI